MSNEPDRRSFFRTASSVAMAGGLIAGYGTFFGYAGRFLYPARSTRTGWMFLAEIASLEVGDSVHYRTPGGAPVVVARQGSGDMPADFLALSSTCPHLGCQVRWEPQKDRFFCPCHNGVFTREGKAIAGPPGEAGQELPRYPLKVERGLLYIEVPLERQVAAGGHDPCLMGGGGGGGEA